jgi:hypothetical protein
MPDAGLVDAAVMEVLANDAALAALCPDGVYWDIRPPGLPAPTAFVIVSHFDHRAAPGLNDVTLYENAVYWVVARIMSTSKVAARQAAARIDELLHGTILDLTAAGYVAMHCARIDRRADTDVDLVNKVTWQYHGGQYELMSYPTI